MGDNSVGGVAPPHFRWNESGYSVEMLPPGGRGGGGGVGGAAAGLGLAVLSQHGGPDPGDPGFVTAGPGGVSPGDLEAFTAHNISLEDLLDSRNLTLRLGPKRQELYQVIPLTIVYCVIFLTGIIGNVSTCIVIAKNKYMQTATNYYLFNLAMADLLVLVLGLPLETYQFWSAYPWVFGDIFCVIRTMAAETSTYASILTITAFTVERYVWLETA